MSQLSAELEDAQALADERLKEMERLSQQIVQLQVDLELAREKVAEGSGCHGNVTTSPEYLSLQAQFSIVQQGQG